VEPAVKEQAEMEQLTPAAVEAEADTAQDLTHKIMVKAETVDLEL
jgi:hypothetical protein